MSNEQQLASVRHEVDAALAELQQAHQDGDIEAIRCALQQVDAAGNALDRAEVNHRNVSGEVREDRHEHADLIQAKRAAHQHETAEQKAKSIIKEHDDEEKDGEEPDWKTRLEHDEDDAHSREEQLTH